jgi:hypothetical protein
MFVELMGTANDWTWVVFEAVLYAGAMLVWSAFKRRKAHIEPVLSVMDYLGWAFLGLFFGLAVTFHWQAFQWPLVLLTAVALIGAGIVFAGVKSSVRKAA